MKRKIILFALCFVLIQSIKVLAQQTSNSTLQQNVDMSVFGIKLGEKFAFSECERTSYDSKEYANPKTQPCFKRITTSDETKKEMSSAKYIDNFNETVSLTYPYETKPELLEIGGNASIKAHIINGNFEGVEFVPNVLFGDSPVLKKLKEKYGEPSTTLVIKGANAASWRFPDLYVSFSRLNLPDYSSRTGITKISSVKIETKKCQEWLAKKQKEADEAKSKIKG